MYPRHFAVTVSNQDPNNQDQHNMDGETYYPDVNSPFQAFLVAPDCGAVPERIGSGPQSGIFLTYSAGLVVIMRSQCHMWT